MAGKITNGGEKKGQEIKPSTIVLPRSPSVRNEIAFLLTALVNKMEKCLLVYATLDSSSSGITSDQVFALYLFFYSSLLDRVCLQHGNKRTPCCCS